MLEVQNERGLSDLPDRYKCVYGEENIRTQARVLASNRVRCPSPPKSAVDLLFSPGM